MAYPVATAWEAAFAEAANRGYGEKVAVPKSAEPELPVAFAESLLSIPFGASCCYRDGYAVDTFQVREYADRWTVELDKYHPKAAPFKHAVADVVEFFI